MRNFKIRVCIFLCIEALLYSTFLYFDLNQGILSDDTSIIKYISLFICFLFSLMENIIRRSLSPLTLSLACAATADIFLVFTDYFGVGVLFFIGVQTCYRYILSGKKSILHMYIICGIIVAIGYATMRMINMVPDITIFIIVFYASFLLANMVQAGIKSISTKQATMWMLTIAIILLVMCDFNVGLYNLGGYINFANYPSLSPLLEFSRIGMWLFYLPSQVLIALLSLRNIRPATINNNFI